MPWRTGRQPFKDPGDKGDSLCSKRNMKRFGVRGVSRRSFLQFCSLTAASLGLGSAGAQDIAEALETKPRTPVIWLHGLECTCCTESFIRSYTPVAKDLVLSMISLDYDDTIMAAAGHQAEEALEETIEKYKGQLHRRGRRNVPLNDDGVNFPPGGEIFLNKIKHVCANAKAVIGWGSCAAWGCVQAAKPNPTNAVPITEVIRTSRSCSFRAACRFLK